MLCVRIIVSNINTTPQWPQCNGMAEHLIKIIKHGMTILFVTLENVNYWDEQLAKVMFGYRCEIQANFKFSPFMIMNGCTPRLRVDNYLHSLTIVVDDNVDVDSAATQFLLKVKLIASIHENVLLMWSKYKRNRGRPMLLEKVSKLLKVWLQERQWSK